MYQSKNWYPSITILIMARNHQLTLIAVKAGSKNHNENTNLYRTYYRKCNFQAIPDVPFEIYPNLYNWPQML